MHARQYKFNSLFSDWLFPAVLNSAFLGKTYSSLINLQYSHYKKLHNQVIFKTEQNE